MKKERKGSPQVPRPIEFLNTNLKRLKDIIRLRYCLCVMSTDLILRNNYHGGLVSLRKDGRLNGKPYMINVLQSLNPISFLLFAKINQKRGDGKINLFAYIRKFFHSPGS